VWSPRGTTRVALRVAPLAPARDGNNAPAQGAMWTSGGGGEEVGAVRGDWRAAAYISRRRYDKTWERPPTSRLLHVFTTCVHNVRRNEPGDDRLTNRGYVSVDDTNVLRGARGGRSIFEPCLGGALCSCPNTLRF
jgi:hypothetical protein